MNNTDKVEKTYRFLEHLTRKYYEKNRVALPDDFILREFALQKWGGKSYIRHLSFTSHEQVYKFLVKNAPRHFYYSSARYDNPAAETMEGKGWRSADLVFDIDADHLPECSDSIVELESPIEGKVVLIDETKCIPKAAFRTQILYDVLTYELGIEESKISIEFSGHRGFHLTIYLSDEDDLAKSSSEFRRELVNYINAIGLREETLKPWLTVRVRRGKPIPLYPNIKLAGLRGRLARIAYRLAIKRGRSDLARLLLGSPLPQNQPNDNSLSELLQEAEEYLSVGIDEQVTIDTKRLIRAPYSVHGKTGLIVRPLKIHELETFNVSEELSAFKDYDGIRVRVLIDIPQRITIVGNRVKFKANDKPKLPASVAVYLMAKGLALIAR
jgi:DNA primase small subunit